MCTQLVHCIGFCDIQLFGGLVERELGYASEKIENLEKHLLTEEQKQEKDFRDKGKRRKAAEDQKREREVSEMEELKEAES